MFTLDILNLEKRTTLRSGNFGHQSPNDAVPSLRRMEFSAVFPVSCVCCVQHTVYEIIAHRELKCAQKKEFKKSKLYKLY
jgi:hypothetical protein